MAHLSGIGRSQLLLLPEAIDDYVGPNNPADGGDVGRDSKLAEKIAAIRGRRERHKALLDELDRSGEDQISLTDPDARAMAVGQSSGTRRDASAGACNRQSVGCRPSP